MYNKDITFKQSKKLDKADVIYYKGEAIFQVDIEPTEQIGNWHFRTWSLTMKSGSGYVTNDIEYSLNRVIGMHINKREC